MAIRERDIAGGWERTYTGDDIAKAKGALHSTAAEAYQEAFHKDEKAYAAHGRNSRKIMTVVPALPWGNTRRPGKYKYNPETKQMEAV